MPSLEQLLQQEINPFDTTTHKIFNIWDEPYKKLPIVESIHQAEIQQIEGILDCVIRDHKTRSIIMAGDSGSGKSIVLGRLRDRLNSKAFFAYISSWKENTHVWRHTLRCIVDSLLQVPDSQTESQLLLWLKGSTVFRKKSFQKLILGERRLFIQTLKAAYPTGIYNPAEFFGVLYDLTNPELYPIATEWLQGNDLAEEDLRRIKVKKSIDTETVAGEVIGNLGRITSETHPIILCFDNLDNLPQLPDHSLDLKPLFDINTFFYTRNLKNFLIVISLVTNNWQEALKHVQYADRASIHRELTLEPIDLDQAEQIWAVRLAPLHQQAIPKPNSQIDPLSRRDLEDKFPSGFANPRSVLQLGYELVDGNGCEKRLIAAFKVRWLEEFKGVQHNAPKLKQFSSTDLTVMLRNILEALQIKITKRKFLPSPTYADHSFIHQGNTQQNIGIIWAEEPNMKSFCNVMKAILKAKEQHLCEVLYLIRAEKLGSPKTEGDRIFQNIFKHPPNHRFIPNLDSLCHLIAYDHLATSAKNGDLLILNQVINISKLESLVRKTGVLQNCTLLQKLSVIQPPQEDIEPTPQKKPGSQDSDSLFRKNVKNFILDFVTQHQLIAQRTIIKHAQNLFVGAENSLIQELIQELCQEGRTRILDSSAPTLEQIICLIPT